MAAQDPDIAAEDIVAADVRRLVLLKSEIRAC